jgi:hypothetical protein
MYDKIIDIIKSVILIVIFIALVIITIKDNIN